jgi:hypothetical protein
MKLIRIIILMFLNCSTLGAQVKKNKIENLSSVVEEVGYFWRLDSNGTNGLRLYTYKRLLNSNLDSIDFKYLLENLGKPNFIKTNIETVEYGYVYMNPMKIPYDFNMSNAVFYISFYRKTNSKYILRRVRDFEEY